MTVRASAFRSSPARSPSAQRPLPTALSSTDRFSSNHSARFGPLCAHARPDSLPHGCIQVVIDTGPAPAWYRHRLAAKRRPTVSPRFWSTFAAINAPHARAAYYPIAILAIRLLRRRLRLRRISAVAGKCDRRDRLAQAKPREINFASSGNGPALSRAKFYSYVKLEMTPSHTSPGPVIRLSLPNRVSLCQPHARDDQLLKAGNRPSRLLRQSA